MISELKDLLCEERLEGRRERERERERERYLITVYKLIDELEKTDKKDLPLKSEGISQNLRGHSNKMRKRRC